jgi:hypothetical protein
MTAASKHGSPQKLLRGGVLARRTRFPWGETVVLGEETDECSRGARRGLGPSTYARIVEITSGRTISQQGLAATCKDRAHKEPSEAHGGFWSDAWARRSEDGGVTPSPATFEVAPTWVTPRAGNGALGTRWPRSKDLGRNGRTAGLTSSGDQRRSSCSSVARRPANHGGEGCTRASA